MNSFIQHHKYEQLAEEDLHVQYKPFNGVGGKKSHNQTQTKQKTNNKKTHKPNKH